MLNLIKHEPCVREFSAVKGSGCRMEMFSPYENLYAEIDPKLRIPLEDLEFEKEIGKGESSFKTLSFQKKKKNIRKHYYFLEVVIAKNIIGLIKLWLIK